MPIQTGGSVSYEEDGLKYEKKVFVYSEEERQEQEINKNNAELIWKIQFFTVPVWMIDFELTGKTMLIYAFISFYTHNGGEFFVGDEKMSEFFKCSKSTVSNSVAQLKKIGLIKATYRINFNGSKTRILTDNSDNIVANLKTLRPASLKKLRYPVLNSSDTQSEDIKTYKEDTYTEDNYKEEREDKIKILPPPASDTFNKLLANSEEKENFITAVVEKTKLNDNIVRNEIEKFIGYWTESNQKGKQRWQMEKVFDVKRRLGTWFGNIRKTTNSNDLPKFIKIT
jgi:DNA-binding transcriptional regulator GbsR (MarR family)